MWERVHWDHPDAELDVFLTFVTRRPGVVHPYVVVLEREGEPAAIAVGRVETTPLTTKIGYRTVYEPSVRSLATIYGGVVCKAEGTAQPLLRALEAPLKSREVDMLSLRALRVGSELHGSALDLTGMFRRRRLSTPTKHWQLVLPETFDDFLAARASRSRRGDPLRRKRIVAALGSELSIEMLATPNDLEQIFHDVEHVAVKTYQRALRTGFADTPEWRARIQTYLEKGWFRAWIMYRSGTPIAFWYGLASHDVFVAEGTGYDPAYRQQRVGIYVLIRVIEDLCADRAISILDFGPGDSSYKRQFGSHSWDEQDILIFAPTFRAARINAARTSILATDLLARQVLTATGMTDRIKKRWRRRLSEGAR